MRRILALFVASSGALVLAHCASEDSSPASAPADAAVDRADSVPSDAARPVDADVSDAEPPCPIIDAGPPGSVDMTFKNGHKAFPKPATRFDTKTGALDHAGRVYVVGAALNCVAADTKFDFAVMRLTPAGDIDGTFGEGGYACFELGSTTKTDDAPTSAIVDAQNRLLVAGGSIRDGSDGSAAVIRLLEDGKIDVNFANAGVSVFVPFLTVAQSPYTAYGITSDADGVIVSGGDLHPFAESTTGFVTRLSPVTGYIDQTFANKGTYEGAEVHGFRGGHIRGAGGSILVPGRMKSPPNVAGWGLTVLGAAGNLIAAPTGHPVIEAGTYSEPQGIVFSKTGFGEGADEHFLVSGSLGSPSGGAAVMRMHGNGTQHAPFGPSGSELLLPSFTWDSAYNFGPLVRQCDGRGVIAATKGTPQRPALARFDEANGELDPSYGNGGELVLEVDAGGTAVGLGAILLDGTTNRIVVVNGSNQNNGPWVHRVNP